MAKHKPNPRFKDTDVGVVQGCMAFQAEKNPLPARFRVLPRGNMVEIGDMETKRTAQVPLFAYGTVRRVLNDLFGDEPQNDHLSTDEVL